MTTQEKQNQYIMGTYGRFPVVLEQGKQESCQDETGKQYIDFGSGIGTNSLGYCNEAWVNAVCKQAQTLQHTSNLYYTKAQADFAEALCKALDITTCFSATAVQKRMNVPSSWQESIALINTERVGIRF